MNDRQARAAQYKLNVTSRKTAHYCIPAAQLYVREVTRPSFSRRLKGVACETMYKGGYDVKSGRRCSYYYYVSCVAYSLWCTPDTVYVMGTFLEHNTDQ